jgi:hypothetical protein
LALSAEKEMVGLGVGVGALSTTTEMLLLTGLAGPPHERVKVLDWNKAGEAYEPLVALVPLQAPEAVHEFELVVDQFKFTEPP